MKEKNKLICDIKTGVCGVSEENEEMELINFNQPKKTVDLYYVTGPDLFPLLGIRTGSSQVFRPIWPLFSFSYSHGRIAREMA